MDMGKQTSHFFDPYTDAFGHKKYRLKTLEQYSRERNASEQPGKQYFKATTLPDIINQAPMPNFKSSRHGTEVEKGGCTRESLTGCANIFSSRIEQPRVVHRFLSRTVEPESCRTMDAATGETTSVHYRREVHEALVGKLIRIVHLLIHSHSLYL